MSVPPQSISLTELAAKLRLSSKVNLTELEAELFVEEGKVRVESGRVDIALRKRMAYWLLIIFSANTVSAIAMIFFVGFGLMSLTDKVIMSVLGATVVQAAAMLVTVTKYLFPSKG